MKIKDGENIGEFDAGIPGNVDILPANDPLGLVCAIQSFNSSALQQFMKNQNAQLEVIRDLSNGQAVAVKNVKDNSLMSNALSAVHRYIDLSEQFQINSVAAYNSFLSQQRVLIQHFMNSTNAARNASCLKDNTLKEDAELCSSKSGEVSNTTRFAAAKENQMRYVASNDNVPLAEKEEPAINKIAQNEAVQPIEKRPIEPSVSDCLPIICSIVSEKTGYPPEMLDSSMSLEADLGIDSIKRIEIASEISKKIGNIPQGDGEALVALSTIGEIAHFLNERLASASSQNLPVIDSVAQAVQISSNASQEKPELSAIDQLAEPVEANPVVADAAANVKEILYQVISEKTGYPVEILEQDMNMESDLGIDSIKRIEIFSALGEKISQGFQEGDLEAITNLSTLGELVDYLSKKKSQNRLLENDETIDILRKSEIQRYEVEKKIVENGPAKSSLFLNKGIVVISKDDSGLSEKLAQLMQKKGLVPVLLALPGHSPCQKNVLENENGVSSYHLDSADEKDIETFFETLESRQGSVRGFIHLSSKTTAGWINNESTSNSFTTLDDLETMKAKAVFLMAKYFYKYGVKDSQQNDRFFVNVMRIDGELGLGEKFTGWSVQGSLLGLCKSLQREWKDVVCKAIDIHPECSPEISAQYICEELESSNEHIEIGRNVDGKRTILTLKEVKHNLPLSNAHVANSVGKDDVFVVLGGGRGITSHCAIALAKEFKCKLVLLGRTVLKEETFRLAASGTTKRELREYYISKYKNQNVKPIELEKMISSAANQIEIRQTIQEIINVGGQALYFDCDATDITSLQKCLSEAEVSFGKITGLVHGAGVLADKKIQRKTPKDFEAVFYTKVKALEAVLQCVNPEQLKYLLLFSSAAAFFGSDGQSDYSMANEVLNKIAYQYKRLHQNTVISSFNWGPWDGGMVTPLVKQKMKDKGINVIPVDIGARYFIEEIKRQSTSNKTCQVVIG